MQPLLDACRDGRAGAIESLIERGIDVNWRSREGLRPLHFAANLETAAKLILHGADLGAKDKFGRTALHIACSENTLDVASFLLDDGACVDVADSDGMTPLHNACLHGHTSAICLLLDYGANIEAYSADGLTPLHFACSAGKVMAVYALIAHGANVNSLSIRSEPAVFRKDGRLHGGEKCTPLYMACNKRYLEIVRLLLKNGAVIDHPGNPWVANPLIAACGKGFVEIVKLLIESRANPRQASRYSYRSPLLECCKRIDGRKNYETIARMLIEAGADPFESFENGSAYDWMLRRSIHCRDLLIWTLLEAPCSVSEEASGHKSFAIWLLDSKARKEAFAAKKKSAKDRRRRRVIARTLCYGFLPRSGSDSGVSIISPWIIRDICMLATM